MRVLVTFLPYWLQQQGIQSSCNCALLLTLLGTNGLCTVWAWPVMALTYPCYNAVLQLNSACCMSCVGVAVNAVRLHVPRSSAPLVALPAHGTGWRHNCLTSLSFAVCWLGGIPYHPRCRARFAILARLCRCSTRPCASCAAGVSDTRPTWTEGFWTWE